MSHWKAALATVSVALMMTGTLKAQILAPIPSAPTEFFSLPPCRVIDTRATAGSLGGPALVAGADRVFPVSLTCGIPPGAKAISVNIAVTAATAPGNLRLHPGGSAVPLVSSINYSAGQTRSNNLVVSPNDLGEVAAFVGAASGTVDLILDVNGYFAPACSNLPAANVGCEFYAVPLTNTLLTFAASNFAVALANSTSRDASIVISGGALALPQTYTLGAAAVSFINLPWVTGLQTTGATVLSSGGAYRIVSDRPISAYQFNPLEPSSSNDASLLLPVQALTGNYRVAGWPSWYTLSGFFAVVATEDQTLVSIAPSASILAGGGLSTSGGSATLNRGDVLQVLAPTTGVFTYGNDLSGSVVAASKPVAVFGGHDATYIPAGSGFADHLEEQLPPAETLGTELVVAVPANPSAPLPKHYVKLVGTQDGTSLTVTPAVPGAPSSLNAGQSGTFEATQDFRVISSVPVIGAQYLEGAGEVVAGDPSMCMVVPSAQFRTQHAFAAPGTFTQNWVTIVAPTGAAVSLDGVVLNQNIFTTIAGTPWAVASVVLSGLTNLHRVSASVPIGAYVYGYDQAASYMFPAGMALTH
jgi:IgGFc binding protein